jgi:hypothetical protein
MGAGHVSADGAFILLTLVWAIRLTLRVLCITGARRHRR